MATWRRTRPALTDSVRKVDDYLRDNFAAIEDAIDREHYFDGDGSSDEGKHKPGLVGVAFVGATSACNALSAGAGIEGSGALCFDTTLDQFKYWDGSTLVAIDFMLAGSAGDTITGTWTVPGSYLDGRDPSVDGDKLDSVSVSADEVGIATGTVAHGSTVNVHGVLPGWSKTQDECYIFLHNMNTFSYAGSMKRIACSATDTTSGWTVCSTVRYGNQGGGGTDAHPDATFVIVCKDRTT